MEQMLGDSNPGNRSEKLEGKGLVINGTVEPPVTNKKALASKETKAYKIYQ